VVNDYRIERQRPTALGDIAIALVLVILGALAGVYGHTITGSILRALRAGVSLVTPGG